MASADDYKRQAAECARIADKTKEPDAKAMLLSMAEAWLRLAKEAEQQTTKKGR